MSAGYSRPEMFVVRSTTEPDAGVHLPPEVVHALLGVVRPGARVLEIGSACGAFVATRTSHYLGLERNPLRVESARARGLSVLEHASLVPAPIVDGAFDVALALHCDGTPAKLLWTLGETWRALRCGGMLLLGVPLGTGTPTFDMLPGGAGASPWLDRRMRWADGHNGASHWTPAGLRELLHDEGFAIQAVVEYEIDNMVQLSSHGKDAGRPSNGERCGASRVLAVAVKGDGGAPEQARLRSA